MQRHLLDVKLGLFPLRDRPAPGGMGRRAAPARAGAGAGGGGAGPGLSPAAAPPRRLSPGEPESRTPCCGNGEGARRPRSGFPAAGIGLLSGFPSARGAGRGARPRPAVTSRARCVRGGGGARGYGGGVPAQRRRPHARPLLPVERVPEVSSASPRAGTGRCRRSPGSGHPAGVRLPGRL